MIQLIQPNFNAFGILGECLEYASREVFRNPAGGSNAWNAWQAAQDRRFGPIPTDVAVPCWFSYSTTINGVYANYGHVVVSVPGQGFYSSPWKLGTNHAVLPSISEVERIYSVGGQVKYVGWSLDILNLKVAEEDMEPIFNEGDRKNINAWLYGEDRLLWPSAVGMKYKDAIGAIFTSQEYKANQPVNTADVLQTLAPGKYQVK